MLLPDDTLFTHKKLKTHTQQSIGGADTLRRLKIKFYVSCYVPFFNYPILHFLTLFCFKFIKHITLYKRIYIANESVNLALVFLTIILVLMTDFQ